MKKAFSLVELIVVIAIIGVLAGVLLSTFSGGTESARCARCLSNLRNLAAGCQSYAMMHNRYPCAGGTEYCIVSGGDDEAMLRYFEVQGWIGWESQGKYEKERQSSSIASASWYVSTYDRPGSFRSYSCLTNGVIWNYVSKNHEIYKCPSHVTKKGSKATPNWSYVMNAYFGWTGEPGTDVRIKAADCNIGFRGLHRSDRILLLAELPFATIRQPEIDQEVVDENTQGEAVDCILQFKIDQSFPCGKNTKTGNETIGFNHKVGKNAYANVVFADGHTEKLSAPKGGMSSADLQELTTWLCSGQDVSFNGSKYNRMTSNADNDND